MGHPLTGHAGVVWSVAVGVLEGRPVLVSGSGDHTVRVWDLASGDPLGHPLTGHPGVVWSVAMGVLEGRPVVVSGSGRTVRVWDLASGDPVGEPLTGHAGAVNSVAVGELEGRPIVVSGSGDHTVRVWDLATMARNSRAIRLGVGAGSGMGRTGVLSITKPINNVAVVGHPLGLTAIRI